METFSAAPCEIPAFEEYSHRSAWEQNNYQEMTGPSFYDSFCKFSKVSKYLGFLPITFSKSSSGLRFSIKSLLTLSSLFSFVILYLFLLTWFSMDDPLDQIFMYLILFYPIVGKVLFFCQLSELITLLQLMDAVDRDTCLPKSEENVSRKSLKSILGFVLVTLIISLLPLHLVITGLTPASVHTYVFQCHSVICLVSQLSIYYFIGYQMCSFYDRYHISLTSLADRSYEDVSERAVEDHRIAHGKLINCIRYLNKSFGPYLGYLYFSINIRCLTECYDVIYIDRPRSRGLQTLQMIVLLVFSYYPAVITDHFIQKNKDIMKHILKMTLKPFPDDVMFQMTYFLRHLKMNVAQVTAAEVTEVNKELITKAMSLFATFFVATLQLEPLVQRGFANLRQMLIEFKNG